MGDVPFRLIFPDGTFRDICIKPGRDGYLNLIDATTEFFGMPFLVSAKPDLSESFVPTGLHVHRVFGDGQYKRRIQFYSYEICLLTISSDEFCALYVLDAGKEVIRRRHQLYV